MTDILSGKSVTLTRQLVDAAYEIKFSNLPQDLRVRIRQLFIDGVGVWLAGMQHPNVSILVDYLRELNASPISPLIGHNIAVSVTDAAWVNGVATHVMDFEPMFDPPTHAVSPVLGALMALCLANENSDVGISIDRNGDRLLSAFTAGIQLQADLRKASLHDDKTANENAHFFPFQKQGFHPPGIVGVMGSALASCIWLGLEKEETCMALGMAASRAGGIAGNIGSMTKANHSGNAARAGLESALLARKGFTASKNTFEEPGGWVDVFGGTCFKKELLAEGMQSLSCFSHPGFAFKFWPAHTAMQIAINAALQLHHPDHKFDGEILIHAPVFKYCDRPYPDSADACRFSFQFNVVQAIIDGVVGFNSYTDQQLKRQDLHNLLKKTTLQMLPDIPAHFPEMHVSIFLSDGRSATSDRWPGHWKMPVTEQQLSAKFLDCASLIFDEKKAICLYDCIQDDSFIIDLMQLKRLLSETTE
jgi:aconitate decarboxylase